MKPNERRGASASPFAPGGNGLTTNPQRLASVTMQAVDQIGNAAADEIDQTAASIEAGAREIADKLRELATAMRGHGKIASERVAEFCEKSTTVLETIRALEAKLAGKKEEETRPEGDPGDATPPFLHQPLN